MRFLSLQSHVAYGYVGNRAATFPLQRLGHEVWAVNTVEFSNHTGYGAWRGRTASAEQVADIVHGIEALGMLTKCDALLTGYVGERAALEAGDAFTLIRKPVSAEALAARIEAALAAAL